MYVNRTNDVGMIFRVNPKADFYCYADADFSGAFQCQFSQQGIACEKLHPGWYIRYAGCPSVWSSKLQTLIALSTTEAEYIALSSTLCDFILIMQLIHKIKSKGFQVLYTLPHVHCKVFEYYSGMLERTATQDAIKDKDYIGMQDASITFMSMYARKK